MHPKSDENKLYYTPFDAARRALQGSVFGFSIWNGSSYPTGSFENLTTDSDSPYPITFDQTLWKSVSFQKYRFSSGTYIIQNFENLTIDLDSPYSITFGQVLL